MKVETVEQTDDEVIELAAKQEMKSLLDGIDPPVTNDSEPKAEETPEEVVPEEHQKEPEVTEPTEKEQLQAALDRIQKLERTLDKTNGTYGNELNRLRRQLDDVKNMKQDITKNITPAQFKRIRDQYGDELADALIGDLTETFSNTTQEQQPERQSESAIDPRLEAMAQSTEQLAGQVRKMAITELTRAHEDWNSVAGWEFEEVAGAGKVIKWNSPSFGEWVSKQDADTKDVVFSSDDGYAIASVLTRYKKENPKLFSTEPERDEPQPNAVTKPINKKLERAVLPTGRRTGAHELLSEDEVIEAARREEQRRIMTGL